LDTIMLALMRIEGKVSSIIGMLESDGQDDD